MIIPVTQQISLRSLSLDDASEIFETIDSQREHLGKWLPFVLFTKRVEDTEAFIKSVLETPKELYNHTFAIRYMDNFAGVIGLRSSDYLNKKTEIGYWLSKEYEGKGIVSKSVQALTEFVFNELKMNRIQIRCATENIKSNNIPKRLGFSFEGVERAGELLSD